MPRDVPASQEKAEEETREKARQAHQKMMDSRPINYAGAASSKKQQEVIDFMVPWGSP